jgi:hypothetical protein
MYLIPRRTKSIGLGRKKIGLTESKAQCRYLKNYLQRDFAAGVYLSELRPPSLLDPYTPPPPALTHCKRVYSTLIPTGKGGGGSNQREG